MTQPPHDGGSAAPVPALPHTPAHARHLAENALDRSTVADVAEAAASSAVHGVAAVAHASVQIMKPFAGLAMRPPLVPRKYWPETHLQALAERGRAAREERKKALSDAIGTVIATVMDQLDFDAVLAKIDIEAMISRIDVAAIARQVIEDVDLPEIIRESSGAVVSETVVGVRVRAMDADERIARIVDRVMLRKRAVDPAAPAAEDL